MVLIRSKNSLGKLVDPSSIISFKTLCSTGLISLIKFFKSFNEMSSISDESISSDINNIFTKHKYSFDSVIKFLST